MLWLMLINEVPAVGGQQSAEFFDAFLVIHVIVLLGTRTLPCQRGPTGGRFLSPVDDETRSRGCLQSDDSRADGEHACSDGR